MEIDPLIVIGDVGVNDRIELLGTKEIELPLQPIAIAALVFKQGSSALKIKPVSKGSKFLLRPLNLFKRASNFDDRGSEQEVSLARAADVQFENHIGF